VASHSFDRLARLGFEIGQSLPQRRELGFALQIGAG